jgi:hypothetical protein
MTLKPTFTNKNLSEEQAATHKNAGDTTNGHL